MLISLIALQRLFSIWNERSTQRALLASMSLRELSDIGLTDAERQVEIDAPFWRAVFAGHRRYTTYRRSRRARTREAVARLSRMTERRPPAMSH